jgi:hypothetical protein
VVLAQIESVDWVDWVREMNWREKEEIKRGEPFFAFLFGEKIGQWLLLGFPLGAWLGHDPK